MQGAWPRCGKRRHFLLLCERRHAGGSARHRRPRVTSHCEQEGLTMPERETIKRAKRDKRQGKSASTQAGEFVREEMHHVREGKHGARSAKQAIAIGLSKARRAGVKLAPPEKGA